MTDELELLETLFHKRLQKELKKLCKTMPPTVSIGLARPHNHEAISARNAIRTAVGQAAWRRRFLLTSGHDDPGSLLYRLDRGKMMLRMVISFMETPNQALQSYPWIAPTREKRQLGATISITDAPESPYNDGLFSLTMDIPDG